MTGSGGGVIDDARAADLVDEVSRLRAELNASRAVSARALARATRLSQVVSALGQLTDVAEVSERAVCEVAEQFGADIAMILVPGNGTDDLVPAAQWGIAARHVPERVGSLPTQARGLTSLLPVVGGPVEQLGAPDWLLGSRPRHLVWGLLTVRRETLGHLLLARRADEPFEPTEVQELAAVVSRIAVALDNGQLYRRTQEQLSRMRRLHDLTAQLAAILEVDTAVRMIAETLIGQVPVTGVAVYLTRDEAARGRADDGGAVERRSDRDRDGDGGRGADLAGRAGTLPEVPARLTGALDTPPGIELVRLVSGPTQLGALLVSGGPRPGSEGHSFLEHLADIAALVLEKALLFERVRAQAETDAMTGLPNRSHFLARLERVLSRCRAASTDAAVVFVDLDGFKEVNDTYGHDVGDQLLVGVARRLSVTVRQSDLAARLGGDEFVVLLDVEAGDDIAGTLVPRLQRSLDEPYTLQGPSGPIMIRGGSSLGVATAAGASYDAGALLRAADAAMYAAKRRRKQTA